MKKIIIFLITIIGINSLSLVNVNASNEFSFYEGDYIQGIWITKVEGGTKYYQKARFFISDDLVKGRFAYCIEPFAMFNENSRYTRSLTAANLSDTQMKRIALLSYFGYTYGNHYDEKWYAITQYMIWKEAAPYNDIYFTDGLNGNRINIYTNEMNEINNLIDQYLTLPSFNNNEINIVEGETITLNDSNGVLSNYTSDNSHTSINGNSITISNLKEGSYTINLTRSSRRTTCIPFFYNSNDSQNMFMIGDVDNMNASLKINVIKTSIELTKIDSDNKDIIPSGDASLSGAIYQLYDSNMSELEQLVIDENMNSKVENLAFGKYYLKEIEPGIGYNLDNNIYDFEITKDSPNIRLTLENEVIKKKIQLHKLYGDSIVSNNENNISFDIFNKDNILFDTITTDNSGLASIILPFGQYLLRQRNTTYGYYPANDLTLDIKDNEKTDIELYDYKISVPNTGKEDISYPVLFILVLFGAIYVKKKIFN